MKDPGFIPDEDPGFVPDADPGFVPDAESTQRDVPHETSAKRQVGLAEFLFPSRGPTFNPETAQFEFRKPGSADTVLRETEFDEENPRLWAAKETFGQGLRALAAATQKHLGFGAFAEKPGGMTEAQRWGVREQSTGIPGIIERVPADIANFMMIDKVLGGIAPAAMARLGKMFPAAGTAAKGGLSKLAQMGPSMQTVGKGIAELPRTALSLFGWGAAEDKSIKGGLQTAVAAPLFSVGGAALARFGKTPLKSLGKELSAGPAKKAPVATLGDFVRARGAVTEKGFLKTKPTGRPSPGTPRRKALSLRRSRHAGSVRRSAKTRPSERPAGRDLSRE